MIDLHSHSDASDGRLTPSQLIALAAETGIEVLGITDHDTIGGVAEALAAANQRGIQLVPGLEFSAEYEPGTMHLLAYGIDPSFAPLAERLVSLQTERAARNTRMVDRLCELGMEITVEEVRRHAVGDSIGRPHMGQAMMARGYVASMDEAFSKWLAEDKPGYVPKEKKIRPEEAIALAMRAGGVPVLAHPYQLKPTSSGHLDEIVRNLVEAGLQGIEVYYSRHQPEQIAEYAGLAEKYNLLVTGGSDFHGTNKPDIKLGTGTGSLRVPATVLPPLFARIAENRGRANLASDLKS